MCHVRNRYVTSVYIKLTNIFLASKYPLYMQKFIVAMINLVLIKRITQKQMRPCPERQNKLCHRNKYHYSMGYNKQLCFHRVLLF